jgi:hypothetical protein
MDSLSSNIEEKTTVSLVFDRLYEFFFRRKRAELAAYAIALLIALAYAAVNDFVLRRPGTAALYEACGIAVTTFLCAVFGYVYASVRQTRSGHQQDRVRIGLWPRLWRRAFYAVSEALARGAGSY